MPFDEEELDPHGECRAEIEQLRTALRRIVSLVEKNITKYAPRHPFIEGLLKTHHLLNRIDAVFGERERCAKIAEAIDSGRGNEKEIAAAIRRGSHDIDMRTGKPMDERGWLLDE
jgi:hypothetical protein